jgi:hypothetical protein
MSQQRPRHITMRVELDEAERIRHAAEVHDETVSAYLRRLVAEDRARTAELETQLAAYAARKKAA